MVLVIVVTVANRKHAMSTDSTIRNAPDKREIGCANFFL